MQNHNNYLNDHRSPSFSGDCDVLLKLDDGSELPTHSHILARASGVCKAMLDDGVLSDTSTSQKVVVPLTDCSRATALSLLSALYSKMPLEHITKKSWEAIASVAHKLDMKKIEGLCDHIAASADDCGGGGNYGLAFFLQKKGDLKTFRDQMDSALQFGRDKVLAACEHCITMDYKGRLSKIIQDMPPMSVVRIVECLRQGVYAKEDGLHWRPWTTEVFQKHKLHNSFQESSVEDGNDWDMEEIAKRCDAVQSGMDYVSEDNNNYRLPFALKGKSPKTFRDLMDYAVLNGFNKALASCEHCIAVDCKGKFNQMIQYMPPGSVVRIIECLCQGYHALEKHKRWKPWTTADFGALESQDASESELDSERESESALDSDSESDSDSASERDSDPASDLESESNWELDWESNSDMELGSSSDSEQKCTIQKFKGCFPFLSRRLGHNP